MIVKKSQLIFLFIGLCLCFSATAQVCNKALPQTTPTNRFINNLDGTVTDLQTGLMWKQCPEGMLPKSTSACSGTELKFNWQGALQRAVAVNGDPKLNLGYINWRVPNIKEYQSIMERQCRDPAINLQVFPNEPGSVKWSSTAFATPASGAWHAIFSYGGASTNGQSGSEALRLVRSLVSPTVIEATASNVFITPPCYPSCTTKNYPYDWGVVSTFKFKIPANRKIVDVVISGSWGDSQIDSSAPAQLYLDGEFIAECISGDLCYQPGGLVDWVFSFRNSGSANWQAKFADGAAQLSIVQTESISVILSNLRVRIIVI